MCLSLVCLPGISKPVSLITHTRNVLLILDIKPGTHHAISIFCWTQRRRKDENCMVCAHQRRSTFVDFTNATVVGLIRKLNRSNNCHMVCAGQRHPSHQPTDHIPIIVRNFCDAMLTQIGDPLSVKMAKVDAEHKTQACDRL